MKSPATTDLQAEHTRNHAGYQLESDPVVSDINMNREVLQAYLL
jgi:hypothetical protein